MDKARNFGFSFVKLDRIGTRSAGLEDFLQQQDKKGKELPNLHVNKNTHWCVFGLIPYICCR